MFLISPQALPHNHTYLFHFLFLHLLKKLCLKWVQIRNYSINKSKAHKGLRRLGTDRFPEILCQLGRFNFHKKVTNQQFSIFLLQ